MLGLIGAHRTGKTTLAKDFSETTGLPFVTSSASQVFQDLGVDVTRDLDMQTRLIVQEEILARAEKVWVESGPNFISDRTPLDFIGYTLADVQKENIGPDEQRGVEAYLRRCIEAVNRHFYQLIYVPPALPYIEEPGKPRANLAYQEHVGSVMLGLAMDERVRVACVQLQRDLLDRKERVGVLVGVTTHAMNNYRELQETYHFH